MVKFSGILWLVATAAAAGCNSFEDPNVVIDLRVLAMTAEPPTQIIDIDLTQPPDPVQLLLQLELTTVCALVADPGPERRLIWSLSLCPLASNRRCDEGSRIPLNGGVAEDPETAFPAPQLCANVEPNADLLNILAGAISDDTLGGLGGVNYAVLLRIGGEDDDPALDQYASKTLQISPRIPAAATANTNPLLVRVEASTDGMAALPLPRGRCADGAGRLNVPASSRTRLLPFEPAGVREHYVVPTLDGNTQAFTESLTYQWIASAGGLSAGETGGPRDITGGLPPLFSDYSAPSRDELVDPAAPLDPPRPMDVSLWIIQRDERLGVSWFESCLRVLP